VRNIFNKLGGIIWCTGWVEREFVLPKDELPPEPKEESPADDKNDKSSLSSLPLKGEKKLKKVRTKLGLFTPSVKVNEKPPVEERPPSEVEIQKPTPLEIEEQKFWKLRKVLEQKKLKSRRPRLFIFLFIFICLYIYNS
jgi:hypothetical protein